MQPELSRERIVRCPKCRSDQITGNKRGYSFKQIGKMFITMIGIGLLILIISNLLRATLSTLLIEIEVLYLLFTTALPIAYYMCFISALPVSLLYGLKGRNNLINSCMQCGSQWTPK
ncbi:hypothetical protein N780_19995 [Pontibacillus chungwhensis BH030062]|uniref:Uncharacterized protein n=1 Tax=Pontibacillus chungwhensis BH030062 TaxID=1385513 RepID=A0A0A2UXK7_9BACI|nr:hypothetical protein N780_19995 [Pontibacillus chungwhensis BH030062]